MIVPRTRLILWVSLIVLPFAALAGTMPSALGVSALAIGALITLAIGDAFLATSRVSGIRVELPEVVRLQKDHPGTFEVRVQNESQTARAIRIGFTFPVRSRRRATTADDRCCRPVSVSRLDWPVTPARSGDSIFSIACISKPSRRSASGRRARASRLARNCASIRIFSTSGKTSPRFSCGAAARRPHAARRGAGPRL